MYVGIYVCMFVCMHACMHACVCVCLSDSFYVCMKVFFAYRDNVCINMLLLLLQCGAT